MRGRTFGLTWLAYASYYFGRKSFPVVKATLASRLGISTSTLAAIDTAYLTAYAGGQFANGRLGDRIGARRLVGFGMLGSAIACAAFGATTAALAFAVLYGVNGLFQSTGWPGTVKAMAGAYGPKERGAVMGVWTTCFQVGPLVAGILAGWLYKHQGWRMTFFAPAAWMAIVGILVLWFLPEAKADPIESATVTLTISEEARAARKAVLRNPTVWLLGISYFGMKLVRYCIDFWQPFYLERALGYPTDQAAYFSTAFQFGGIFGSIAIGYISDRWFPTRRGAVAMVMTAALTLALLLYAGVSATGKLQGALALALVGFCLFGPDALISGVAAQDMGGKHATGTVAGFINGCGSVGAIAQGALVAGVSAAFGWRAVFQALMGLAAFSTVALAGVWWRQSREAKLAGGEAV